jgi:8-oxo-dGTP pyrophosphatase MutT (NUDIX family)
MELMSGRWPYYEDDPKAYVRTLQDYFFFRVDGIKRPVGLVHYKVVHALPWPDCWTVDIESRWLTLRCADNFEARTKAVEEAMWCGHQANASPSLRIWHDESFPVYSAEGRHIFNVDGCGVDVIGARSFAVYLLVWTRTPQGPKYWIQERGRNKTLLPLRLDTCVSGRLRPNESPFEGMVREAGEEANLPSSLVRQHLKQFDVLGVAYPRSNQGEPAYQHHTQYVYELEVDEGCVPSCDTDEVEAFRLMTLEEVRFEIDADSFIPSAQLVFTAHFIRSGIVNADVEENLANACVRMHRSSKLFVPEV